MSQPDTFTKFLRGPVELLRRAAKDIEAMCQESQQTAQLTEMYIQNKQHLCIHPTTPPNPSAPE